MNKKLRRRHAKKQKRASVITVSLILSFSLLLAMLINYNVLSHHASSELVYQPIVVRTGDTLWKLAETSGLNQDTRTIILMIKKYNTIPNGVIYPGQVIYIPTTTSHLAYK